MAGSNIQLPPDSTGKNVQTFLNTIGGISVHAEAAVPVDSTGTEIAPLTNTQLRASNINVSGTFFQTTQPISGTVAATQSGTWNIAAITTLPAITGTVNTNEIPDATSTFAPSNATSTAYESNRVIKGSAGVLFAITGFNSSASDQFIQIHDANALPANGVAPVITFLLRASRNFSISFGGKFGRFFSTGIVICNSSTGPTKTIGASDCWFDAQFK